jgi:hypothetical protein
MNASLLDAVGTMINNHFTSLDFSPSLLFIATWDRVAGFNFPNTVSDSVHDENHEIENYFVPS